MGNNPIVQVPLDSINVFGYQKIHFVIIQLSFENFIKTEDSYHFHECGCTI